MLILFLHKSISGWLLKVVLSDSNEERRESKDFSITSKYRHRRKNCPGKEDICRQNFLLLWQHGNKRALWFFLSSGTRRARTFLFHIKTSSLPKITTFKLVDNGLEIGVELILYLKGNWQFWWIYVLQYVSAPKRVEFELTDMKLWNKTNNAILRIQWPITL